MRISDWSSDVCSSDLSYWKYAEQVPDILSRYGAKVLARGGKFHIAEGSDRFNRFVVVEFPTMEAAIACYESPEYQDRKRTRLNSSHYCASRMPSSACKKTNPRRTTQATPSTTS